MLSSARGLGLFLLLSGLIGCGSRARNVAGDWTASQVGHTMLMTVKPDGTWTSRLPIRGQAVPFEGTWSVSGDVVHLTPTTLGGRSVESIRASILPSWTAVQKRQVLEMVEADDFLLSEDGKTMTLKGAQASGQRLTFTRR